VYALEITKLSKEFYEERLTSETPILTFSGSGWNAAGMHHIDVHRAGNKWKAAVDGRSR